MRPPFYDLLQKPPGTPPGWVFGPVWTILYVTMAVVLYRIVSKRANVPWWIVGLFGVQLALNLSWSPVFFEQQNIRLAFFIVSGLVITLAMLVVGLHRYDPIGAWLLVPYLLWVAYAAYLNHGIMVLNRPSR